MAIKEIELKVPTSYADITLKQWIELQNELEAYKDDGDAVTALMLWIRTKVIKRYCIR